MPRVNIEEQARKDPRFVVLGKKLNTTKFDALGRMIEVWAHCTENNSYFLCPEIIDACAELDGFHKLILLTEVGLAEQTSQGIRIKGTEGRIEWLGKIREGAKKGGAARVANAQRDARGRLVTGLVIDPAPRPAPSPGQSSALTLTPTLKTTTSSELGPFNTKAQELLGKVKPELIESWCETYKDPVWLTERLNAAANWVIANPKKGNKKDWPKFFNNWLTRKQFDTPARATTPSQAAAIVAQMQKLEQSELSEPGATP